MRSTSLWPSWLALFLAIAMVSRAAESAAAPLGVVKVAQGELAGAAGREPRISVFRGIPFAAAPVGALRWRPPQPPATWSGVRSALESGPSAMQAIRRSLLPWTEEYMFRNGVSEDCLTLNIWTPARSSTEKLAVYVYVHGGAYTSGSGEVLLYDGEGLARLGVVVVTINYRLGAFGFLAHPELTAESPQHASGNYGLMDQIAALTWVKENIRVFGGDPQRVTVGGQSAGAGSVHHLLVSPVARGLFQRAIVQSGSWRHNEREPVLSEAETAGRKFAEQCGAASMAELRGLSPDALLAKQLTTDIPFRPDVDGWITPDQVGTLYRQGKGNDIPVLVGWTADERSFSKDYGKTNADELLKEIQRSYGERGDAVAALYPISGDAGAAAKSYWRDVSRAELSWWVRIRRRTSASQTWAYFFAHAIPWPEHPDYGAFHSGELPYVFNNLALLNRPWTATDRRLAEQASAYWVNFIKNGDPNGPGLPVWSQAEDGGLMRFGDTAQREAILSQEKERALDLELAQKPGS